MKQREFTKADIIPNLKHKKHKRKRRIIISENLCPVCSKPLDKWQDIKFCSNCGYKSKEGQVI